MAHNNLNLAITALVITLLVGSIVKLINAEFKEFTYLLILSMTLTYLMFRFTYKRDKENSVENGEFLDSDKNKQSMRNKYYGKS
jgi:uncharacterized protein YacL